MTKYSEFKQLHQQAQPLLLGNVWNVQSAKIFEKLNFSAIGTSSAAIAHSLGYKDGEQMPFKDLLFIVDKISKNTKLPLSVDLEFGYGTNAMQIANNIIELHKSGVAGINIEDSIIENEERLLKDKNAFALLLKEIISILNKQNVLIFINVRCDAFLLNVPNALEATLERVKLYEDAGADGLFLPFIKREDDIKEIVANTKLPLNVMCMPQLPNFKALAALGVKRISMGNFLNDHTYSSLENITVRIQNENSFNALF